MMGSYIKKTFSIRKVHSLQYTPPPRTSVFNPIRTDGTFERWPKKNATQISTMKKIPIEIFNPKKSLQNRVKDPYKDFCLEKSISLILGQSLEAPQHGAHIQVNFKNSQSPHKPQHRVHTCGSYENSKSSHATTQNPRTGELWKLRVLTRHSTGPTHMGIFELKSSHTTAQSSHTWELRKLKVLTRHSTGHTHRGTMKTTSPNTLQHRTHTQGNFVENLKVSAHHSTGSTHKGTLKTQSPPTPQHSMGTLKLKVFIHHSTKPTPRGTLKIQSPHTPQHRAHTHVELWKTQSLYTPQHWTTHIGTLKKLKVSTVYPPQGPAFRYDKALRYLWKFPEFFHHFHTGTIHKVPSTGKIRPQYRENTKSPVQENKAPVQGK